MPTEKMTTDKNECLLNLFIALANNKIVCIVINDECKYDLNYNEKHLILFNILHSHITTAKMITRGYNEYRIIINEELPNEIMIDIEDDYMYCYKEGFPTEEDILDRLVNQNKD